MPQDKSLLVVEDCPLQQRALVRFLGKDFGGVFTASTAHEALQVLGKCSIRHALIDLDLPDGSGLDLISPLRRGYGQTRIVILTGFGSIASCVAAMRLGADEYLTKPASLEQVACALRGICDPLYRTAPSRPNREIPPLPLSLARAEWEHIHRVLAESRGNVSEAARRLGIHRQSLQRKLRKAPVAR